MMSAQYKKRAPYFARIFFFVLLSVFFVTVPAVRAATPEFTPLVGLPGLDNLGKDTTIPQYINQIYLLTIAIGALLGVMRLAWAGVKYSLSDVVTEKSEAKHDMTGVLMGLAILLIPFVVLREINPDLVRLDVLRGAQGVVNLPKGDPSGRSFVCTTPECQATCIKGEKKGEIKIQDNKQVCVYDEIRNFAPKFTSLTGVETEKYINCRQTGKVFDFAKNTCSTQTDPHYDPGFTCADWGGLHDVDPSLPSGTCASKVTTSEIYRKADLKEEIDLRATWIKKCGSATKLKTPDDGLYVTYMCVE